MYGHGQLECGSKELIQDLEQYNTNYTIYNCNVVDCVDPTTHDTCGHSCRYCGKRDKHMKQCPCNGVEICDDNIYDINLVPEELCSSARLKEQSSFDVPHVDTNIKDKEYIIKYAGMGCVWYIRNNNSKYEYIFMHSDSMGQYGEDTSDVPRLNAFIYKYKLQI